MNILTFDIEDWFHTHQNRSYYSGHIWEELPSKVEANTEIILDMLDELELKATFFVLGWVAAHNPDLVKKIYAKGHEIGAHSHWHHSPQLLSPDSFEKDLKLCLSQIQDLTGEKITMYRAPGFNLNIKDSWAFNILAENGIQVDSSIQQKNKNQSIPLVISTGDKEILEFPLIVTQIGLPYSGGGYFRALPHWFVDYYFNKRKYNLIYLHPRDFDVEYPLSNLFSVYRNVLNMYNTKHCKDKTIKILSRYHTVTMGEAATEFKK